MADNNPGFNQMMSMWKEGQEAFLKAQNEAAEGFSRAMTGVATATSVSQPFTAEDSMKAWRDFIGAWAPAWDPSAMAAAAQSMQGEDMFKKGSDALFGMLDPSNWTDQAPEQLRVILQNISQGPRFADLATPQVDAAEAWRETLDYQNAAMDFSKVMQSAWNRAFERYSKDFSLEDLQSGEMQEALDAWLKAANAELLDTQASSEFMDAQKRLLRASTEIKARQREVAESWCDAYQMPTRTEVDDMAKIVHELRREVRKLKRELAAVKADIK